MLYRFAAVVLPLVLSLAWVGFLLQDPPPQSADAPSEVAAVFDEMFVGSSADVVILGNSAARTWDIEAYAPGVDQWLEVSSVSWFADYQARRANIRYRPAPDPDGSKAKGTVVAHTVNGSAMGWPRTVAAYLETHRRPDGGVAIVDVLRPYLGGAEAITPR